MIFNFLNILSLLTIFTGVICLVDIIWRRCRKIVVNGKKHPVVIDYARSFFPVLLVVLIIRSFLFQPYRVPTGSLEPTIMPGDMILVNQYDYGLRSPLWEKIFFAVGYPKPGQIALFNWPVNPAVTFVKRVIGVPGDHVSYVHKVLYINGKVQKQTFVKNSDEIGDDGQKYPAMVYKENLQGIKHEILIREDRRGEDFKDLVVPKDTYFMMGDNRDDSDDSRSWGFVPIDDFIGRAMLIFMSWDSEHHDIRWHRIGNRL